MSSLREDRKPKPDSNPSLTSQQTSNVSATVEVYNLPPDITSEQLIQLLSRYGPIQSVSLKNMRKAGRTKREQPHALVTFTNSVSAIAAYSDTNPVFTEFSSGGKTANMRKLKIIQQQDNLTIHMYNLPILSSKDELQRQIEQLTGAPIAKLIVQENRQAGVQIGWATYANQADATLALKTLARTVIGDHQITSNFARQRGFDPDQNPQSTSLFIRGIPLDMSELELTQFILDCLPMEDSGWELTGRNDDMLKAVVIPTDRKTKAPMGWAYAHFHTPEVTDEVFQEIKKRRLKGRELYVEFAKPQPKQGQSKVPGKPTPFAKQSGPQSQRVERAQPGYAETWRPPQESRSDISSQSKQYHQKPTQRNTFEYQPNQAPQHQSFPPIRQDPQQRQIAFKPKGHPFNPPVSAPRPQQVEPGQGEQPGSNIVTTAENTRTDPITRSFYQHNEDAIGRPKVQYSKRDGDDFSYGKRPNRERVHNRHNQNQPNKDQPYNRPPFQQQQFTNANQAAAFFPSLGSEKVFPDKANSPSFLFPALPSPMTTPDSVQPSLLPPSSISQAIPYAHSHLTPVHLPTSHMDPHFHHNHILPPTHAPPLIPTSSSLPSVPSTILSFSPTITPPTLFSGDQSDTELFVEIDEKNENRAQDFHSFNSHGFLDLISDASTFTSFPSFDSHSFLLMNGRGSVGKREDNELVLTQEASPNSIVIFGEVNEAKTDTKEEKEKERGEQSSLSGSSSNTTTVFDSHTPSRQPSTLTSSPQSQPTKESEAKKSLGDIRTDGKEHSPFLRPDPKQSSSNVFYTPSSTLTTSETHPRTTSTDNDRVTPNITPSSVSVSSSSSYSSLPATASPIGMITQPPLFMPTIETSPQFVDDEKADGKEEVSEKSKNSSPVTVSSVSPISQPEGEDTEHTKEANRKEITQPKKQEQTTCNNSVSDILPPSFPRGRDQLVISNHSPFLSEMADMEMDWDWATRSKEMGSMAPHSPLRLPPTNFQTFPPLTHGQPSIPFSQLGNAGVFTQRLPNLKEENEKREEKEEARQKQRFDPDRKRKEKSLFDSQVYSPSTSSSLPPGFPSLQRSSGSLAQLFQHTPILRDLEEAKRINENCDPVHGDEGGEGGTLQQRIDALSVADGVQPITLVPVIVDHVIVCTLHLLSALPLSPLCAYLFVSSPLPHIALIAPADQPSSVVHLLPSLTPLFFPSFIIPLRLLLSTHCSATADHSLLPTTHLNPLLVLPPLLVVLSTLAVSPPILVALARCELRQFVVSTVFRLLVLAERGEGWEERVRAARPVRFDTLQVLVYHLHSIFAL
ncbi:hypothetical protein BLNAU_18075 [Blattamonas nauphoetae]|uniref:RRM domain-containing protein n=1 Tax=Blattamonas nauphoetae TaxID=2049346 RepID=A0ABQ9X6Q0_9EUKA|nr:hypothetical protein BLNAU_18075 [Blattamonas nauphoetae]